ncbi:MAG: hypothetical protein P4L40_25450 [Terracidiphilus sp.]|nr:hypothetical protein [Terracidiphilus sp.]
MSVCARVCVCDSVNLSPLPPSPPPALQLRPPVIISDAYPRSP